MHLDQADGFSSELAGKAREHRIGLGGQASGAMQRMWRMTAAFPS
jgi:hypothetical protein